MTLEDDQSGNYENDPVFKAWARRIRRELIPKLEDSACSVSLVPTGETDVKFAVELGLSIMLGKPIIAVIAPGTDIPLGLAKVADEIVEVDWKTDHAKAAASINAAVSRVVPR